MTRFSFVPFVSLREKFSFVVKIIFIVWQRLSRAGSFVVKSVAQC
jgi:hypothetical protein